MRETLSWGVSLPRMFGIPVKVHWLFFLVTLGMFLRQVFTPGNLVWWGDVLLFTVILLFGIVLLHELGHCLGGRLVGGEPQEILIWPLGGLAFVDVPHTPRANFITTVAGPMVNLILAVVCGGLLAVSGYVPNPLTLNPYTAEMRSTKDGRIYTSEYGLRLYEPGTTRPVDPPPGLVDAFNRRDTFAMNEVLKKSADASPPYQRAEASGFAVWVFRVFWLNCLMLAFNLLPAYPMDGGQLLMTFVWARRDHATAVRVAGLSGVMVGMLVVLAGVALNETLVLGLGVFMAYAAYTRLTQAEAEDTGYGDFSQGYTSLEKDDPPPPKPKPVGPLKKWLQARAARRIQQEIEAQQADEERMDQLLDKIARTGKASLTAEEQRFLDRQSERYKRNK